MEDKATSIGQTGGSGTRSPRGHLRASILIMEEDKSTSEQDERERQKLRDNARNYETALFLSATTHLKADVAPSKPHSVDEPETIIGITAKEKEREAEEMASPSPNAQYILPVAQRSKVPLRTERRPYRHSNPLNKEMTHPGNRYVFTVLIKHIRRCPEARQPHSTLEFDHRRIA